jgi:hypothetical protein
VTQLVPECQQILFSELAPSVSVENVRGQLGHHHHRAMKERKVQMIKARVSTDMKRGIDELAGRRGESEAVIIREALSQYLRKSTIGLDSKPSDRPKKQTNAAADLL